MRDQRQGAAEGGVHAGLRWPRAGATAGAGATAAAAAAAVALRVQQQHLPLCACHSTREWRKHLQLLEDLHPAATYTTPNTITRRAGCDT